jgi:hypothetical protein
MTEKRTLQIGDCTLHIAKWEQARRHERREARRGKQPEARSQRIPPRTSGLGGVSQRRRRLIPLRANIAQAASAPSPGTPGEGWGEGDFERATSSISQCASPAFGRFPAIEIALTPALSRITGRGGSSSVTPVLNEVPSPSPKTQIALPTLHFAFCNLQFAIPPAALLTSGRRLLASLPSVPSCLRASVPLCRKASSPQQPPCS